MTLVDATIKFNELKRKIHLLDQKAMREPNHLKLINYLNEEKQYIKEADEIWTFYRMGLYDEN